MTKIEKRITKIHEKIDRKQLWGASDKGIRRLRRQEKRLQRLQRLAL